MNSLGIIALLCVAFIFGTLVGILLISMCCSNERYDNSQASYELGYQEGYDKGKQIAVEDFEDTCSHCGMVGPSFDKLNVVDRYGD